MEMWKMHRNNDRKTSNTTDGWMRVITNLTHPRRDQMPDLEQWLEEDDVTYYRDFLTDGKAFSDQMKRHHLISMIPMELFSEWQFQPYFTTWNHHHW